MGKRIQALQQKMHFCFFSLPIKAKLLIMLLVISIIPIMLLGNYAYSLSKQQVLQLKSAEVGNALKSIQASVQNQQYDKSIYALISISQQKEVVELLSVSPAEWEEEGRAPLRMEVNKQLLFQSYEPGINHIYLLGKNGALFADNEALHPVVENLVESEQYQAFMQDPSLILYGPIVEIWSKPYQTLAHKVFGGTEREVIGCVFTWISHESLTKTASSIAHSSIGDVIAVDASGMVLSSLENEAWIGRPAVMVMGGIPLHTQLFNQIYSLSGTKYLVNSFAGANPNMGHYFSLIPYQDVIGASNHILIMTVTWTAIITIAAVLCAIAMSSIFVNPIVKLAKLMKEAELGNIRTFTPKYRDEMGYIIQCYNDMAKELNSQNQLLEEGRKRQKKLEMEAFEAQIKPHFLYNTLSTIIWLIEKNQNEKASDLTHSLAEMFRIGVSRGATELPLSKELDHARHYLNIQKIRYEDEFTYSFAVDENLLRCRVIKMILQPLVENAIYHGMRQTSEGGEILISASRSEDSLLLTVADSGGQMDAATRAAINSALARQEGETMLGVGIRNVDGRIKSAFGEGYGLHYEIDGNWTKAVLKLPFDTGGEPECAS